MSHFGTRIAPTLLETALEAPPCWGDNVNKPTRHRLTAIEREMVFSIAKGCTDRDIARQFLLSTDDVKRNLAKLFGKVGVDNRLQLVIHAAGSGLLGSSSENTLKDSL